MKIEAIPAGVLLTLDRGEAEELAKQIKNVYPRYVNRLLDNLRIQLEELTKEDSMIQGGSC